ncbi:RNA polymerase sigma factor [Actinomadura sp. GTD37]|uniref:RNA polymerase sigma factor n=1 Tax=Actinomadura sp. GTD37 TaxID=1778030 RepID=UPI0035C1C0E0
MRGDLGSLYDAHADRLYAYCWSLVGDQLAAAAVGDTFNAAVHQPPRGDSVLWLYSLSRTACAERGAFTGDLAVQGGMLFADPDPLLRAAAGLRADHREVLLLWAGEWLEPHDIARVLGLAPDTVLQLLAAARTRLERSVLDILMRGTAGPRLDLISAFEKGRLPRLLAGRAPAGAPGWLRDRVLAACEQEAARPLPSVISPSPLVVIGAERKDRRKRGLSGGVSRGLGAAAGVAASAAAVIGLLISWPAAKGGGGEAASMVPSSSEGQTSPASAKTSGVPQNPLPGLTGSERATGGAPSGNPVTSAFDGPPQQAGGAPAPPATSPADTPSPEKKPVTDTPSRPDEPSTPPEEPPTTPPATPPADPTTPPDDGSTPPTTPPTDTPTDPPTDGSGTPSPNPTANPTPEPGQG